MNPKCPLCAGLWSPFPCPWDTAQEPWQPTAGDIEQANDGSDW